MKQSIIVKSGVSSLELRNNKKILEGRKPVDRGIFLSITSKQASTMRSSKILGLLFVCMVWSAIPTLATDAPTSTPTPTDAPTSAPTDAPTAAPTDAPATPIIVPTVEIVATATRTNATGFASSELPPPWITSGDITFTITVKDDDYIYGIGIGYPPLRYEDIYIYNCDSSAFMHEYCEYFFNGYQWECVIECTGITDYGGDVIAINVPAGTFKDSDGNDNLASASIEVMSDNRDPSVDIMASGNGAGEFETLGGGWLAVYDYWGLDHDSSVVFTITLTDDVAFASDDPLAWGMVYMEGCDADGFQTHEFFQDRIQHIYTIECGVTANTEQIKIEVGREYNRAIDKAGNKAYYSNDEGVVITNINIINAPTAAPTDAPTTPTPTTPTPNTTSAHPINLESNCTESVGNWENVFSESNRPTLSQKCAVAFHLYKSARANGSNISWECDDKFDVNLGILTDMKIDGAQIVEYGELRNDAIIPIEGGSNVSIEDLYINMGYSSGSQVEPFRGDFQYLRRSDCCFKCPKPPGPFPPTENEINFESTCTDIVSFPYEDSLAQNCAVAFQVYKRANNYNTKSWACDDTFDKALGVDDNNHDELDNFLYIVTNASLKSVESLYNDMSTFETNLGELKRSDCCFRCPPSPTVDEGALCAGCNSICAIEYNCTSARALYAQNCCDNGTLPTEHIHCHGGTALTTCHELQVSYFDANCSCSHYNA